jgi:ferritin
MLGKVMQDAINEQIKNELYSGYMYLSMSAYLESENLPGMAHWMRVQEGEERAHAMKFFNYVVDRGGLVTLQAIDQPPAKFAGSLDVFEKTLEHEKKVTGLINHLYEVAVKEKDYASQAMLQWFITEQIEEEKNATQIIAMLQMLKDKRQGELMLDHELGERGKK